MRYLPCLALATALLAPSATSAGLDLEPCRIGGAKARCGTLTVPENRAASGGTAIGLNVVVVPARTKTPEPDPLFVFHGGPGGAATDLAPAFLDLPFRADRDLVFVDQRGTGNSNPISCPRAGLEELLESLARFDLSRQLECVKAIGADPRHYTTREFIADIDAVREALGAERINLFGGSYGTRAAFDYIAAYPGRTRSAILRGVAPTPFVLPRDFPRDSQAALDAWLSSCEDDRGCNGAFPELRRKVFEVAERLEADPAALTVRNPLDGKPIELTVDRAMFASAVHYTLYIGPESARLPARIDAAHDGNYRPLIDGMVRFVAMVGQGLSDGLFLSVACAEDLPFATEEELRKIGENTLLGSGPGLELKRLCSRWPHAELPAKVKQQRPTDVPLLLINGALDPVTPPSHTQAVLPKFSHALHVVIPGASHASLFPGCVLGLAARFLQQGSAEGLSADCAASIRPPRFALE